ncbi:iron reductase domain protein [Lentithecium fluviatile CBS 122367]|uniref:Iron reductase domain protein n=1 Tax=Lentithecium fluviatile CBS 122367 TaxID=1168545 RepID=A0A6G1IIH0_9PLEO|nr:iron reductase domain protein [Lentithecium fluviatile CBS 122367]
MLSQATLVTITALASIASAGVSTQCISSDICFSLNIPDATVSSGTGDIYLQITGPTSNSWVAVAQGNQMVGAHYFIMYTSAEGVNVTVSPRVASAEEMPTFNADTQLVLLEGSGVADGVMTANIRCSNCDSWSGGSMDLTAQDTSWIWAYKSGDALSTNDTSATIVQHDRDGHLTFDSSAQGGSSVNPFTNNNGTSTTPTSGSSSVSSSEPDNTAMMITAHAILACIAMAGIFPIGGILVRLFSFPHLIWVHAVLQVLGLCAYIAAVGLGLKVAIGEYMGEYHAIIGLVLFAVFFLQPLSGYLHHALFKKYVSRTVWSYIHLWMGRLGITLGMINAGFGFQLMGKTIGSWEVVAYTVVAVIIWTAYVGSAVVGEMKRKSGSSPLPVAKTKSRSSSDINTPVEKRSGSSRV